MGSSASIGMDNHWDGQSLRWTIIGQICLNRHGGPVHVTTQRTVIRNPTKTKDPRLSKQLMKVNDTHTATHELLPYPNKFVVKEAYDNIERTVADIFHLTLHDNETSLSVENCCFEEMKDGTHKNDKSNWEMPLGDASDQTTSFFPGIKIKPFHA